MPTMLTYWLPGQYGVTGPTPGSTFGTQTQVTRPGAAAFTSLTTWSQAATHRAGVTPSTPPRPQGYHPPFISCAKVTSTGEPNARICAPNVVRYPSYPPAAMSFMAGTRLRPQLPQCHGSISTNVSMPSAAAARAKSALNGSFHAE